MNIQIEIPDKTIADVLCCAWEGGSNYWAEADGQPYDLEGNLLLRSGDGGIPVYDLEDGRKRHTLTLTSVRAGLSKMATKAPKQLGAILAEDADAITGDVLLQLCIFGEIKYG